MTINYRTVRVNGLNIFYREAGKTSSPTLLLLHGFPTSSHMFRNLIPLLAEHYHLVAPDFPGFGQTDLPNHKEFAYTFANLAIFAIASSASSMISRMISRDGFTSEMPPAPWPMAKAERSRERPSIWPPMPPMAPAREETMTCIGKAWMSCGRLSQSSTQAFFFTRIGLPE